MSYEAVIPQDLDSAIAARARGRPDEAILILERLWRSKWLKSGVGFALIDVSRALARDIIGADNLSKALGWLPEESHRGFDALDADLVQELRSGGSYDRLRRTFGGHWMAHWVDLYEADDALAKDDVDHAAALLARVPRGLLPVPWYFIAARIAAHRRNNKYSLVAACLVVGLNPKLRNAYLLIGDLLVREGRAGDAIPIFSLADNTHDTDWLADSRRSLLPIAACEFFAQRCLANTSVALPAQIARIRRLMRLQWGMHHWKLRARVKSRLLRCTAYMWRGRSTKIFNQ